MKRTIIQIADDLNIDEKTAAGLVHFLLEKGLAKVRGERPSPSGRGKGAHVYEVSEGAGKQAGRIISRLE